jgi:hypothetical protein
MMLNRKGNGTLSSGLDRVLVAVAGALDSGHVEYAYIILSLASQSVRLKMRRLKCPSVLFVRWCAT